MANIKFFNKDVIFQTRVSHFTEKEITDAIPQTFEGKEYFIQFYLTYDGIWFPDGADFVSDEYMIEIEYFYSIRDTNHWFPIKVRDEIEMNFSDNHIPFATDSSGNLFLIELPTGKIKYTEMEYPYGTELIAPSFIDFCNRIQQNIREE